MSYYGTVPRGENRETTLVCGLHATQLCNIQYDIIAIVGTSLKLHPIVP